MNALVKGLILAGGTLGLGVLAAPSALLAAPLPKGTHPTVTVENTRAAPVEVYMERGDMDTRLGSVAADSKGVLPLPSYLTQDEALRIVVQPKEGLDLFSQDITAPRVGTVKVLVPRNDTGYVPTPEDMIPNPGAGTTTLTVENPRDHDVSVYVEHGVFDSRIGTVPANQLRTFNMPKSLTWQTEDVQIFIHPKDGLDLSSQFFALKPGAHIEVKVPLK